MKKIIIPIIVVVAIVALIGGGYLVMDSLFPKADLINVPSASSVASMTVIKNESRQDGEQRAIASADIDSILSLLQLCGEQYGAVFDETDFIEYLNTVLYPDKPSKKPKTFKAADDEDVPEEYRKYPHYNF